MRKARAVYHVDQPPLQEPGSAGGFTLIELLIAVAVFLIVAGAAFALFNQQVKSVTHQQNLSAVNIGVRNAMAQLQMDLSSAGQNLLNNVPCGGCAISLGIVIQNNAPGTAGVPACTVNTANWAYPAGSACFDSIEIPAGPKACTGCTAASTASYPGVPVMQIITTAATTSSGSALFLNDPNSSDTVSTATIASNFQAGDELLILNPSNTSNTSGSPAQCVVGAPFAQQSNFCMTAIMLTSSAVVASSPNCPNSLSSCVELPSYDPTNTNGTPTTLDDPLGLFVDNLSPNGYNYYNALSAGPYGGTSNNAYVIDLGSAASSTAIWYSVQQNPANASDTQLVRCVGAPCAASGGQPLTDQVIGFKVGAALWNFDDATSQTDLASYFYNAAQFCNGAIWASSTTQETACATTPTPNDPYDFSLIQSVRVSLVARTTPNMDVALSSFKNGFDNGPYMVQQASVVVDLRNMSNPNFGN